MLYSPSGRSCRCVTVTDLVSRAPTPGNLSINGTIGMIHLRAPLPPGDCTGFRGQGAGQATLPVNIETVEQRVGKLAERPRFMPCC